MNWLRGLVWRFRLLLGLGLEPLAKDLEAQGHIFLAIIAYRKILSRNSSYVRGWLKLASLYETFGALETAHSAYGAAVAAARRPTGSVQGEVTALRNRARLDFEAGKLEESEADLREAFRLAKQHELREAKSLCLGLLAGIAESRGDLDKAEILRRQSAELGSGQAAAGSE